MPKRDTTGMKVGDSVKVTEADLRTAPWRSAATWVTDGGDYSASDVLSAAALDWQVVKNPLETSLLTVNGTQLIEVPNKVANVKIHNGIGSVVGVTSPSYTILQNNEVTDFLEETIQVSGATYDSAGELRGGSLVYFAAKMPQGILIDGNDAVDTYIVIKNGHDGTTPLQLEIKHLRLACLNGMAGWRNLDKVTIRHTARMADRHDEVRRALAIVNQEHEAFQVQVQALYEQSMTNKQFEKIVNQLFPLATDASERTQTSVERTRDVVWGIYQGETQNNIHGSQWGAWQAFVEYADWAKPVRGTDRAERFMTGGGDAFKARALELITA